MGWQTLQSRKTVARLSLLCKFRANLTYAENAEIHPVTYLSASSSGHAYKLPTISCDVYKFSIFPKNLSGLEQTAKTSSLGKIA